MFKNKTTVLVILWIVVLSVLYSLLSVIRHNNFQSGAFDLGLYDQTIWKYSQFLSPYNTIKDRFILGDHLNLTIPLIAPLYYLWDDVRIILIFQAFWISFSTLAIYKLCKHRKFSSATSFILSFIYSIFYGIQYAVFFDFHAIVIGVGLIAWFLYFFETGRKKMTVLSIFLMLLTQENMGIALSGIGIFYMFKKQYRKLAILFIFLGFAWSIIAAKIIAYFSPVGFQYFPSINLNPVNLFIQLFDTEEKRQVWLYSFGWFSFLPVFSIGSLLSVTFDLSQYFVTGPEFSRMWSPFMHHRAILAPILILGLLDFLEFLRRKKINVQKISFLLLISPIFMQFYFHFPLNKLTKPAYWKGESWMQDNYDLFKLIPKGASIASQQNIVPHLSHRKEIYLVYPRIHDFDNNICGQRSCWWLDFPSYADYLVVDLHPNQWVTQLLETNENFESAVNNMKKAGKIKLEKEINNAKLYKINH
ncbi:MAG: DUF2079 domain-containing protein [Patescibacteria group bacterium]|nr:DUF2079 domain-containing protein [Patescibacteria group bacterium]